MSYEHAGDRNQRSKQQQQPLQRHEQFLVINHPSVMCKYEATEIAGPTKMQGWTLQEWTLYRTGLAGVDSDGRPADWRNLACFIVLTYTPICQCPVRQCPVRQCPPLPTWSYNVQSCNFSPPPHKHVHQLIIGVSRASTDQGVSRRL